MGKTIIQVRVKKYAKGEKFYGSQVDGFDSFGGWENKCDVIHPEKLVQDSMLSIAPPDCIATEDFYTCCILSTIGKPVYDRKTGEFLASNAYDWETSHDSMQQFWSDEYDNIAGDFEARIRTNAFVKKMPSASSPCLTDLFAEEKKEPENEVILYYLFSAIYTCDYYGECDCDYRLELLDERKLWDTIL